MTEQPTEQWVHIFLRLVTCAPAGGGGPASALRRFASGSVPSVARLPATRPDRRKKPRRSRPRSDWACEAAACTPLRTGRSVRLINIGCLSFGRIAVDAVEVLDLR